MPTSLADRLMPPLRRLAAARVPQPRTDGQLLTTFVQRLDPASFEALVRRHGPMVLGICRRVIADRHAADDAFQAVFVVLARRAAAVKPREQVANFLFGVAYRTALKARGQLARRRSREKQVDAMPEPALAPPDFWSDVQPVIDEELAALPDKLRLPVLLCDVEGRPQREVAQQLGLPPATLANRLASARRKLAGRLTARGVTLAGGALAAVLTSHASAAVPVPLAGAAAAVGLIAVGSGAGVVPANVLQLSEGVVRMMALSKLKLVTAGLLAGLTMLAGAGAGLVKADDKPLVKAGAKIRPDLDDREYLRRVCDSLRGSPATPTEIGYFMADQDVTKRKKVVTWLTEGPKAELWAFESVDATVVLSWEHAQPNFRRGQTAENKPGGQDQWLRARSYDQTTPLPRAETLTFEAAGEGHATKPQGAFLAAQTEWVVGFNANTQTESDEAYLIRVFEAARGGKPSRIEREYFLADNDAKKREKLLDLILSDPATAKRLGPDWKKNTLTPPINVMGVFVPAGNPWADRLIDDMLAKRKSDEQLLEALTLAATGR